MLESANILFFSKLRKILFFPQKPENPKSVGFVQFEFKK